MSVRAGRHGVKNKLKNFGAEIYYVTSNLMNRGNKKINELSMAYLQ
jgi:hypothetical protein